MSYCQQLFQKLFLKNDKLRITFVVLRIIINITVMKKSILSIAILTLITFTSCKKESETVVVEENVVVENTVSGTYKTDSLAVVKWTGNKLTGSHNGTIKVREGQFEVTDGKLTGGNFVLDMNSIAVLDLEGKERADLEGHLKGSGDMKAQDHFFNTSKFPEGSFKITSVVEENGAAKVMGDLTLKGITNAVEFPATITATETDFTIKTAKFAIDRTKWNVNYNSKSVFENIGDKVINDEIDLEIEITAKK